MSLFCYIFTSVETKHYMGKDIELRVLLEELSSCCMSEVQVKHTTFWGFLCRVVSMVSVR